MDGLLIALNIKFCVVKSTAVKCFTEKKNKFVLVVDVLTLISTILSLTICHLKTYKDASCKSENQLRVALICNDQDFKESNEVKMPIQE